MTEILRNQQLYLRRLLLLFLVLLELELTASSNLKVFEKNLASIVYDDLHELAILDQIENYRPPIKSLKTRRVRSLSGNYDFCLDSGTGGFKASWQNVDLSDVCPEGNLYKMPVPSAFNDVTSNSTVKNYIGWFWYQTKIDLSSVEPSGQHFIQIDSINYLALVWLKHSNEESAIFIGSHVGGHLPLTMNISQFFNDPSQVDMATSELTLTLAISNRLTKDTIPSGSEEDLSPVVGYEYKLFKPDFDFFHFAGIMGDVNLIRLPATHITQVEMLANDSSDLNTFRVCLNQPMDDRTRWLVYFNQRNLVDFDLVEFERDRSAERRGWFCQKLHLKTSPHHTRQQQGASNTIEGLAGLEKIKFGIKSSSNATTWDDVYELRFSLTSHNLMDQYTGTNSISKLPRQLQGFGMHQEQSFSGRTMSLASIMKDIYLLKEVGANVIRTSHYPYSEAYLDACDTAGLMVIAECPAVGLNSFSRVKLKLHKQILLEMMQRDSHHPSILMWSIANEPRSDMEDARTYFKELLAYARVDLARFTVEAKRPLTAAIAQAHNSDKIADMLDVVMINRYYGWYDYPGVIEAIRPALMRSLLGWSTRLPGKPLMLSEFGADTLSGLHSSVGQLFTEEYQRDLIIEYERCFDELAEMRGAGENKMNFIGSMIWNFADFSTHNSVGRVYGNRKGIFTRLREPKLAAQEVKRIYRSRLMTA